MGAMDRRAIPHARPLFRGGADFAGRLVASAAAVALSPPSCAAPPRRGLNVSTRFGLIWGLLLATLLAAGCASTSGLSTEATLKNADALAAGKSLAGTAGFAAAWPATEWWRSFNDPQLDQLMEEA